MTFVPNDKVAQLSAHYIWNGQEVMNTIYVATAAEMTPVDLQNATIYVGQYLQNTMLDYQNNTLRLVDVMGQRLAGSSDIQYTWIPTGSAVGLITSPGCSNNVSIAVTFKTGFSGRSYQGRNFWLGMSENDTTNNQVNAGVITNILTAYNGLIAGLEADTTAEMVVYSRINNGTPRTLGLATKILTATVANDIIDSQRRRLPGRGR